LDQLGRSQFAILAENHITWHHQDSAPTSHGLQSSFSSKLHLHFIFVAFSSHLVGHVPINRTIQLL